MEGSSHENLGGFSAGDFLRRILHKLDLMFPASARRVLDKGPKNKNAELWSIRNKTFTKRLFDCFSTFIDLDIEGDAEPTLMSPLSLVRRIPNRFDLRVGLAQPQQKLRRPCGVGCGLDGYTQDRNRTSCGQYIRYKILRVHRGCRDPWTRWLRASFVLQGACEEVAGGKGGGC